MLLTLSGETLNELNRGLKKITERTQKDGRSHDLTLLLGEGDTGLTVHCGQLPNAEALEKLAHHCRLRKYAQGTGSWFGLAVRAGDGLPKFGLNFRFPWKQDNAMDAATKGMAGDQAPRRARIVSKSPKIGRNEPCFCGSGKKFKKCCLQ
ncbi:hypothetical protein JCM17845_28810 [Iodidimonas gelatinilytica]|uniref:Uncharacterized protein n=1 Tax=Iodidimonas gelatinilytica TaxID=1236966 RepID=A0A5A7N2C5_9PROT|nr:SEC-C metal-binding domain-containing protein [Iodidimonas gelatinilytica]GER02258.1 hypothetical protein JCM17845_28810 [Iodidimonas gelatinilytica]